MHATNLMKLFEDKLIDHIRESLADYEEPYVSGVWENFNKKEEKEKQMT